MPNRSTPIWLVTIGWLTVPVFGIAVVATRGGEEVGYVLVTSAIAIAMGVWVWRRGSRVALVTSLLVGSLLLLQQLGYTVAAATSTPVDTTEFLQGVFGLAGASLIVVGAVGGLLARRSNQPMAASSR